jgi:ribosomal protein S12 methylthiotransferase accessory factor
VSVAAPAGAWTTLDESLERLETLASRYTGIVRRTYDLLRSPDDARLHRVSAEVAEGASLVGGDLSAVRSGSGGYHHDRRRAVAAALAETAERYAGCFVPEDALVTASAATLGDEAVPPERFALFHPHQYADRGFPFTPFASDTVVRWTRGRRLRDGAPCWLPAQLVYLGWRAGARNEARVAFSTSNGLACGVTEDEATVAALLEALERDAFMIAWYARLSLPLLDWRGDGALERHARRHFDPTGLRYSAVDLSPFWNVPTVVGVVHGRDAGALGVGAASATTVQEAWRKGFAEAFAVRTWGRVRALDGDGPPAGHAHVRTFADHVELYAHHAYAGRAAFLDASTARRHTSQVAPLPHDTPAATLAALVARVHDAGYEAYAADVTSPDVREAGLSVVKVLVPELCQLDVDYRARFLGSTRLYEVPAALGLRPGTLGYDDLNPDPHPFP